MFKATLYVVAISAIAGLGYAIAVQDVGFLCYELLILAVCFAFRYMQP